MIPRVLREPEDWVLCLNEASRCSPIVCYTLGRGLKLIEHYNADTESYHTGRGSSVGRTRLPAQRSPNLMKPFNGYHDRLVNRSYSSAVLALRF